MDAVISLAIRSASMAGIIWRHRARSRGSQNFRQKTGSVPGRQFRLPRAGKKKAGQSEIAPPPWNRDIRYVAAASNAFPIGPKSLGETQWVWQSLQRESMARPMAHS